MVHPIPRHPALLLSEYNTCVEPRRLKRLTLVSVIVLLRGESDKKKYMYICVCDDLCNKIFCACACTRVRGINVEGQQLLRRWFRRARVCIHEWKTVEAIYCIDFRMNFLVMHQQPVTWQEAVVAEATRRTG